MTKFEKRLLAGMMALLMTLICIGVSSYSVYASKSQDKSMESVEEIYNENNETYGTNSSSNASGNSNGIVKANSGPVIVSYNVKSNDGLYTYNVYDNDEIGIAAYNGTDAAIEFPSEIDGKKVVSIEKSAFVTTKILHRL